jgi:hypothetical protein
MNPITDSENAIGLSVAARNDRPQAPAFLATTGDETTWWKKEVKCRRESFIGPLMEVEDNLTPTSRFRVAARQHFESAATR